MTWVTLTSMNWLGQGILRITGHQCKRSRTPLPLLGKHQWSFSELVDPFLGTYSYPEKNNVYIMGQTIPSELDTMLHSPNIPPILCRTPKRTCFASRPFSPTPVPPPPFDVWLKLPPRPRYHFSVSAYHQTSMALRWKVLSFEKKKTNTKQKRWC